MRIGLIDVDGHNFPSLPLMKISAYHKQIGDSVEWYEPFIYRLAGRAESKPGAYKTGDMERRSKALCSSAGH